MPYDSMGLHAQSMSKFQCLIETGAGRNLINKSFINPTWAPCVKRRDSLNLRSANKKPISLEEVIQVNLQIDNLRKIVWIGVVDDFVVDLLMGTSFFDRYVQDIFPRSVSLCHDTRDPSTY